MSAWGPSGPRSTTWCPARSSGPEWANLAATLPPPDVDADGGWRAVLVDRYVVVRHFVPRLCRTIEFGATAEAAQVLEAFRQLPMMLEARATKRVPAGYLDADRSPHLGHPHRAPFRPLGSARASQGRTPSYNRTRPRPRLSPASGRLRAPSGGRH